MRGMLYINGKARGEPFRMHRVWHTEGEAQAKRGKRAHSWQPCLGLKAKTRVAFHLRDNRAPGHARAVQHLALHARAEFAGLRTRFSGIDSCESGNHRLDVQSRDWTPGLYSRRRLRPPKSVRSARWCMRREPERSGVPDSKRTVRPQRESPSQTLRPLTADDSECLSALSRVMRRQSCAGGRMNGNEEKP
jgi:hypothetical protein